MLKRGHGAPGYGLWPNCHRVPLAVYCSDFGSPMAFVTPARAFLASWPWPSWGINRHIMTSMKMSFFHMVFLLLRRARPAAPKPLTTHEVFQTASPRRNAGSKHIDASVSVSFC